MTVEFSRRDMLRFGALSGLVSIVGIGPIRQALAEGRDTLTIAYPGDVPTWDPNARTHFLAHPLFRCVFDQPLTLTPDLKTAPSVITKWQWQDNGTSLHLDFRSDVMWHTGEPFTAEDFKFTYFDRLKAQGTVRLDIAGVWRLIKEIEVVSPTKAIMRFTQPMPSAIAWLSFLANFLVPKAYITKVGYEEFVKKPMGSGPFKIAEYTQGARIALEANDKYWGVKSPFKRVTFEIVRDASARVAAIEAKRVDIAAEIPVREAVRLSKVPGIASRIDPSADIVIIHIMNSGPFTDERVRLAAHHAINKEALSKAFFNGVANPISVPAAVGTPGYPANFKFQFSEAKAMELLKAAGYSKDKPAKLKLFTFNGVFPSDFDIARAIEQMWRKVGIQAEIETIEFTKYQELLRAKQLPEATIFRWGNFTGDPELYSGNLLNPRAPFSAWKSDDMGARIGPLMTETDEAKRIKGYQDAAVYAINKGYNIPVLQGVLTIAHQTSVKYKPHKAGWILANEMTKA